MAGVAAGGAAVVETGQSSEGQCVPVRCISALTPSIEGHLLHHLTGFIGDQVHGAQMILVQEQLVGGLHRVGKVGFHRVHGGAEVALPLDLAGSAGLLDTLNPTDIPGLGDFATAAIGVLAVIAAVAGAVKELGGVVALFDPLRFVEGGVVDGTASVEAV